jgi:hypothetical protein
MSDTPDDLPDNVSIFPGVTPNDFEPAVILRSALRGKLESCMIIGWDENGDLFFSSSKASGPDCLWLIEHAKRQLLEAGLEDVE